MKLKILILVIIIFMFICCEQKGSNIKFIKWNEALIEKDAISIAQNEIAGYKTGVFQSKVPIENLKKAYMSKGYKEDKANPFLIKKENVSITLINLDNQKTNIMIRIEPK